LFACGREHPLPADHRFNRVLASLAQGEQLPWADHLELVELAAGQELQSCDTSTPHVHFPTSALVVLIQTTASGAEAPVALVGNDGVVGVAALMGTLPEAGRAKVLHPGHAWRLPTSALSAEEPGPSQVLKATVGYLMALTSQFAQTAFCQQHHNVEQRLARWLLNALDRLPGNDVALDLGELAALLGVPAEALAGAAAQLVGAGALVCEPGRLVMPSRDLLHARSCGCHSPAQGEVRWSSPPA
jgi:CRP-like cAMP-binding protein